MNTNGGVTIAPGSTLSGDGSYGAVTSSKTPEARRLCADLLRQAVVPFRADGAAVYAVAGEEHGGGRLVLVAATGTGGLQFPTDDPADGTALEAMRTGRRAARSFESQGSDREVVAVPCSVDGEVAAVLVAQRLAAGRPLSGIEADGSSLLALGLAVERYRVQLVLEESLAEGEAIRRQLDAYAVDLRSTYLAERDRSQELADALSELTLTYESTVRGLAIAVEAKDEYTGGHLQRVSRYGMAITAVVAPDHADDPQFEYGFLLHDVGKLVVPDAVLMKDGPLDELEWAMIRGHPEAGKTILDKIPFLAGANEIVHSHHERWDGLGYPRGLKGEEIPLGARIFPLADVFDAMTTTRPYREALSIESARLEVKRGRGTQFCPEAVDAFMSIPVSELERVRDAVRPGAAQ
jgi:HD-GYP domain-containing protein (c-di-GMP phosphodiesterase class II)